MISTRSMQQQASDSDSDSDSESESDRESESERGLTANTLSNELRYRYETSNNQTKKRMQIKRLIKLNT